MKKQLPTRLASEPLIEVVSEVRFDADADIAVSLLPGILHSYFGPFDQQSRSFPAEIAGQLLAADASMAYRAHIALLKGNRLIQIGPRVVSVACRAPYPGWSEFNSFARSVFDLVSQQSFVKGFDWVSLKYVDLIRFDGSDPSLGWLDAEVVVGGVKVTAQPSMLRVEFVDGPVTTVVQVGSPAQAQDPNAQEITGVLVDVDTIHRESFSDFPDQYPKVLEDLHARNKHQFFSLLTVDTVDRLGPEYS